MTPEQMRDAAAQWCADEADRCEDAAKWGGHRKYVQDCKAAAFALRNAAAKIGAIPVTPTPVDASPAADPAVKLADALAAERAIWTQAIETYFDATAVMDVERHVDRIRAGVTP